MNLFYCDLLWIFFPPLLVNVASIGIGLKSARVQKTKNHKNLENISKNRQLPRPKNHDFVIKSGCHQDVRNTSFSLLINHLIVNSFIANMWYLKVTVKPQSFWTDEACYACVLLIGISQSRILFGLTLTEPKGCCLFVLHNWGNRTRYIVLGLYSTRKLETTQECMWIETSRCING